MKYDAHGNATALGGLTAQEWLKDSLLRIRHYQILIECDKRLFPDSNQLPQDEYQLNSYLADKAKWQKIIEKEKNGL